MPATDSHEYPHKQAHSVTGCGVIERKLLDTPRNTVVYTLTEHGRGLGQIVLHALIHEGTLSVQPGPYPGAQLTITTGPAFRAVIAGETAPAIAVSPAAVSLSGDELLFEKFATYFRIWAISMKAEAPANS